MKENYWQVLGLTQAPFSMVTSRAPYFPIKEWDQRIELLTHLCQFSQVLLVVTGETGCGKSTFKERFIPFVSNQMSVGQLGAQATLTPPLFWMRLGNLFNIDLGVSSELSTDQQCDHLLTLLNEKWRRYLLVIDDAHTLPDPTLSILLMLVNKQAQTENSCLHILLLGDASLSDRLTALTMQNNSQDLIHTMLLTPFSLDQTKRFLEFSFKQVGFLTGLPMSDPEFAQIYRYSQGSPARIIQLTQEWMTNMNEQHQASKSTSILSNKRGLWIIASGIVAIAVTVSLAHRFHATPAIKATEAQTIPQIVEPETHAESTSPTQTTSLATTSREDEALFLINQEVDHVLSHLVNVAPKIQTSQPEPNIIANTPSSVLPVKKASVAQTKKLEKRPARQQQLTKAEAMALLNEINNDAGIQIDLDEPSVKPALLKPLTHKPIETVNQPSANTLKPTVKPVKKVADTQVSDPATQVMQTKPKATTPTSLNAVVAYYQRVIQTQLPTHYTLQLAAFQSMKDAVNFIKQHELTSAHFVPILSKHKRFYAVVLGNFNSQVQASRVLTTMPAAIIKLKPWIRSIRNLQQAMIKPKTSSTTIAQTSLVKADSLV